MIKQTHCCQLRGKPTFYTGALGYTWKTKRMDKKKKRTTERN